MTRECVEKGEGDAFINQSNKLKNKEKKKKQCCTWKCCGISTGITIIVVVILLVVAYLVMKSMFGGNITSENSQEWEAKLSQGANEVQFDGVESLAGVYELVSYDEGFKPYLKAIELPSFVISLVMGMSETLEFIPLKNGTWTIIRTNDFMEDTTVLNLGEKFEAKPGKSKMVFEKTCNLVGDKELACISNELNKGWTIENSYKFSPGRGLVSERFHVTKDVRMKKFFKLVSGKLYDPDNQLEIKEGIKVKDDGPSPFSENEPEEDDFWGEEEDDDDFFDEDDEWKK